jgi:asparagine synthetase B (glutamine-hydrolysing)
VADQRLGTRETYSTSYPFEGDASNAEKEYPITAATALGMRNRHWEPTTAQYLDAVPGAIAAVEQPLDGLQTPLLGALFTHGIDEGVSVLLCGEGADNYLGVQIHEQIFRGRRGLRVGRHLARRPIVGAFRLLSRLTWKAYAFRARLEQWQALSRPVDDPEHPLWEDERYGDPAWARS